MLSTAMKIIKTSECTVSWKQNDHATAALLSSNGLISPRFLLHWLDPLVRIRHITRLTLVACNIVTAKIRLVEDLG